MHRDVAGKFSDEKDKTLALKVLDKGQQALKQNRVLVTGYFDPHQQRVAESVLRKAEGLTYYMFGGYPGAERQRIALMPAHFQQEHPDMGIVYLRLEGNFKFASISHRDVLGALLSLGIKRESLGDIFVADDCAKMLVTEEIAPYILANLTQVHQVGVTLKTVDAEDFDIPSVKSKTIKGTVASLRLDAVASMGYSVSRTKMASVIKAEQVKLNWQPVKNPSALVKAGDVISVAGRGRVEVEDVGGVSRKGRVHLFLKKYL